MRTTRHFLLLILCLSLNVPAIPAQDKQRTDQTAAPQAAVIIQGRSVRFFAPSTVQELKLQLADQHGTLLYDSGLLADTDFHYNLHDSNGQPLAPGLYIYTLSLKTPEAETPQQQQGHLIIEQGGERFWLTAKGEGGIGAEVAGGALTLARTPERTTAGAGYIASGRTLSERAGLQRAAQGRSVTEKKAGVTREGEQGPLNISGSGTTGRLTKWLDGPGEVVGDSVIHETASGDLGIGTTTPGGVLDVRRSSPNPLIGRFWNTGTGPAQLRFVGGTGATSQFLITDTAEWLTSIAVNNSIGMQFRVRGAGTPNTENELNNSARLTISRNGAVGIGLTAPSAQLHVAMGNGRQVLLGTPNGEVGVSVVASNNYRGDLRHNGSLLQLVNGLGGPPPATNGIVIDTDGKVGIGVTAPAHRQSIGDGPFWTSNSWKGALEMTNASAIGWKPNNSGQSFGIGQSNGGLYFFRTNSGPGVTLTPALYAMQITDNGDLAQPVEMNGVVKAMLYVSGGILIRCYNGVTGTSNGDCGFSVTGGPISPIITFPFQVDNRFAIATAGLSGGVVAGTSIAYRSSTSMIVHTYTIEDGGPAVTSFTLIVY